MGFTGEINWGSLGCLIFSSFCPFSQQICCIFLTQIHLQWFAPPLLALLLDITCRASFAAAIYHRCVPTLLLETDRFGVWWKLKTWNSEYLYETVHFNFDHAIYCSTQPVLLFPILQDTHCIYQSVGSFAVYLLTLSAKVCLNGNSGNKQYSWGGSVHGRAEFWVTLRD